MEYKDYWSNQKVAYQSALKYIKARQEGTISSFKTPWPKVNDAGVNGLEWQSMLVIAGRPATGKTLIKDQIVREAFIMNKGYDMRILEFTLEMVAVASKVREFSSVIGKSYKYVCSAYSNDKLTDEDFKKLYIHSKSCVDIDKYPIDYVETPVTVEVFKNIIIEYMETHAQIIDGKKIYTKTVVTLDHCGLLKEKAFDKSKTEMLYDLGEALTALKKKYPILFIILSQLKRETELPERNENGKYGNYVLESDLLGGDALFQHADMVIGIKRPAIQFIEYYGPDRYIIKDDSVLVFHFLKVRNGDTRMSFFNAEFDKMRISEANTPGKQQKRSFS
jgi:replicative DNA helicase